MRSLSRLSSPSSCALLAPATNSELRLPEHLRWWGMVYGPFRERALWWGLSQMLFRLLLVATAVFLWAEEAARLGVFTLLCAASLVLLLQSRPNKKAADNNWELAALAALLVMATSRSMNAPDAWLAALTLGMGGAITVRLVVTRLILRRPHQPEQSNSGQPGPLKGAPSVQLQERPSAFGSALVTGFDALPSSASTTGTHGADRGRSLSWVTRAYNGHSTVSPGAMTSDVELPPARGLLAHAHVHAGARQFMVLESPQSQSAPATAGSEKGGQAELSPQASYVGGAGMYRYRCDQWTRIAAHGRDHAYGHCNWPFHGQQRKLLAIDHERMCAQSACVAQVAPTHRLPWICSWGRPRTHPL
jgi:hypothetical protein